MVPRALSLHAGGSPRSLRQRQRHAPVQLPVAAASAEAFDGVRLKDIGGVVCPFLSLTPPRWLLCTRARIVKRVAALLFTARGTRTHRAWKTTG